MYVLRILLAVALIPLFSPRAPAQDAAGPKPIPGTRPEAKQALEKLKSRTPRLPLPPLTAEEEQAASAGSLGIVNNARMRKLYLPAELQAANTSRQPDPAQTLDPAFTIELFWIASRVNNCHYCLGHQEVKLTAAGVAESRIAALDCDWSQFTPADRAAFTLARKLTLQPDQISDADFHAVQKHFTPAQVLEMVMLVARYNATNRWTDALGIPQEGHRDFLTETPEAYQAAPSVVAITSADKRLPLLSREETEAQLAKCRERRPRLPLVEDAAAREVLPAEHFSADMPQWARLLATFPVAGKALATNYRLAETRGTLPAELKAEIAWVAARHDRAWYALDRAAARLAALGYSNDQMFALDDAAEKPDTGREHALALSRKLTRTPHQIDDADIAVLRASFSDSQVAEIVYLTTQAAFFNRLTEAANLPLEPRS
jgi:AhpD family alkylhydroperoxidase